MKSPLLSNLRKQGYRITLISGSILLLMVVSCSVTPTKEVAPSPATITFDRDSYASAGEVFISVKDIDENRDPLKVDTIEVTLSVWDRDKAKTVILSETGVDTGTFRNVKGLPLTNRLSTSKDPKIHATGGDVIKVTYIDRDDPSDRRDDQAKVAGGRFSYTIDPSLKPTQESVGGETNRPIGVVINPDGMRDEFVVNELILNTEDQSVLEDILRKYEGKILYDGTLGSAPHPILKDRLRPAPELWGYKLVRVNPAKADLRYLVRRMTESGLTGNFVFSSEDALRIGAIILTEQKLGRNVTLNSYLTNDACPCEGEGTQEALDLATGINEDAFGYQWFDTLDSSEDNLNEEYLGVTKVWQLLNGLVITNDLPNEWLPDYQWEPVRLGIIDGGFEPNDDWPGGVRPDWCLSFNGGFSLNNPFGISTDCAGVNQSNCGPTNPCPWHGTMVYGAAAAIANNSFGAAGSAGSCDDSIVEVMLSEWDGSRFSWAANIGGQIQGGADIINISSGGNCGEWCRKHELFSGRSMLSFAIDDAVSHGVLLVATAGNDDLDLDATGRWVLPCEYDGVICVSSISWRCRNPAADCFEHRDHNYGSNVDIWAPDRFRVWAPDDANITPPFTPAILHTPGGTSIAAPYVSGVLAQMKALYPPEARGTFNLSAARSLLQNNAHTNVSTSARVNAFGGFINPYGMALSLSQSGSLDSHLIDFEIADIDENEPDDNSQATRIDVRTGGITTPETVEGIITTEEDTDIFEFTLDERYDVQLSLIEETHPGEILLSSVISPNSATQLSESLGPGTYRVHVAQDRTAQQHPFNCYTLEYSGVLTEYNPDVFDDQDISTPPPEGSPNWRNDEFGWRTLLELRDDPSGSSIGYADLNFDTLDDRDYFRVRLPPRTNTGCRQCSCAAGFCAESLVITVNPQDDVGIRFYYPNGSNEINPITEGWEFDAEEGRLDSVIEIKCPYNESVRGTSIVNADHEIAFVIEPDSTRTEYDLTVAFHDLQEDICTDASGGIDPRIARIIGSRIPEEDTPYYFPMVRASWDCQDIPGCDPPYELMVLKWEGGDLSMEFEYFSLVRQGDPVVELVDSNGAVVSNAVSSVVTRSSSSFAPRKYEAHGQLTLGVKSLQPGHYFIKMDAPLPTYFLYRRGDSRE